MKNLKELTLQEQKDINGGGLLFYALLLGIYVGYKETEYEHSKK